MSLAEKINHLVAVEQKKIDTLKELIVLHKRKIKHWREMLDMAKAVEES